jgi:hypothetical protein
MASGTVWVADTFALFLGGISVVGILVAPIETGGSLVAAVTEPLQRV